jgi:hypothetical protein
VDLPVINNVGFMYYAITLEDEKKVYNATKLVMSFALMLPNQDKEERLDTAY